MRWALVSLFVVALAAPTLAAEAPTPASSSPEYQRALKAYKALNEATIKKHAADAAFARAQAESDAANVALKAGSRP